MPALRRQDCVLDAGEMPGVAFRAGSKTVPETKMRNQTLDVLRGVAILMVLGFHYSYFRWWHQIGWAGVDLFFVLSGFLISGLLFDEIIRSGRLDLKRFWIRRGFKIYPPYYLLVGVTAVSFLMTRGKLPHGTLAGVFFLQNYLPHIWQHTWSLAVEEHFYFLLPLLLAFLAAKDAMKAIPWIFGCAAVACLGLRTLEWRAGVSAVALHSQTHLRIDSLFAGVAIRYWRTFLPSSFRRAARKPLWMGSAFALPAFFLSPAGAFMNTAGLTLLYIAFGFLLVWSVERPCGGNPAAVGLAWIGKHSYSIYLWHLPLWALLFRGAINFAFFAEGVLFSILFGAALSMAVERPSLAVRDRLFPSASSKIWAEPCTVRYAAGQAAAFKPSGASAPAASASLAPVAGSPANRPTPSRFRESGIVSGE